MELIDAHAHMSDRAFGTDLETVLQAAAEAGVVGIVTVSENLDDARTVLELAERFPLLKPCAGLYPDVLDLEAAEAMVAFIRAHEDRVVGIGEVGLDHWVVKETNGWEVQEQALAKFVALSEELDLPLNSIPGLPGGTRSGSCGSMARGKCSCTPSMGRRRRPWRG